MKLDRIDGEIRSVLTDVSMTAKIERLFQEYKRALRQNPELESLQPIEDQNQNKYSVAFTPKSYLSGVYEIVRQSNN